MPKGPLEPNARPDDIVAKDREDGEAEKPAFGRFSRRSFLGQLGAAGLAATTSTLAAAAPAPVHEQPSSTAKPKVPGSVPVSLNINGSEIHTTLEPRVTLLDALRENLQMPGTKKGCDHGQCGACTVHINGRRVNSCLTFAIMHQGDKITTIEGLAQDGKLHPVQAAFVEHDGFQCGYCTPGQIMSAVALLKEPVGKDDDSVREFMSGNICRCGAYTNIVAAVQAARQQI
ncbi:Periplasmic aromatic aldehyde oxidoreductase, iron-sulfur subunit YagT [Acidisarcina polymorpha]|uniref:Periplasmic aromatic aldehyde oxidoreductase, iron-sulfur subunit YagT n=1 Tax=Acidisarcina polymorpha TaxID=2211140 RepID=A0A2Z5FUT5_9BACT|nr:(2Fe-2S)-binding protein [Acidisarcina polymorpha]AXC10267.1 Periplasmic aromatic aldehyde oxidoreductase, iron-sulfur subunit YagT [Acidisarcina polymorpha]